MLSNNENKAGQTAEADQSIAKHNLPLAARSPETAADDTARTRSTKTERSGVTSHPPGTHRRADRSCATGAHSRTFRSGIPHTQNRAVASALSNHGAFAIGHQSQERCLIIPSQLATLEIDTPPATARTTEKPRTRWLFAISIAVTKLTRARRSALIRESSFFYLLTIT
jgi:hypothetical protein